MMNLNKTAPTQIQLLPRGSRLDFVYESMDELHSAICEGGLEKVPEFDNPADLINWLRDLIYTAQESINELENAQAKAGVMLRVIHKQPRLIVLEKVE